VDSLRPLDAAFLDAEDADRHVSMAIASVAVIEGPAPSHAEFVEAVVPRLRAIRRTQQRIHRFPLDIAPPAWVDTGAFDEDYHIRRSALPSPGDDLALCALVGRVMGQRLDRDRPLWECWVIEGLERDRWALLLKIHHSMADGVSTAQLYSALFDAAGGEMPSAPWTAGPGPGVGDLMRAIGGLATSPVDQLRLLARGLRISLRRAGQAGNVLGGLRQLTSALVPVTPSTLTGPIGQPRRYAVARTSLTELRAVSGALGVTVNDVVLAAISLAFRDVLRYRGEHPDAHSLRALVPVSVRAGDQLDNQVSLMLPMLPVDLAEPSAVVREVHRRMAALKQSHEAGAGEAVTEVAAHEPFSLISMILRVATRLPQRSIVTVTTNVPGSRDELAVLGRRILEIFPYVPIAVRLRTGIAALSYHGKMTFGITADFDSNPDIWFFAGAIERAVSALTTAARPATDRPVQ
jgi:diacylglycerol O-acyltransferase